jgi:hypothetical protein
VIGIIGMGLMVFSMMYTLRRRKWVIKKGRMAWWLRWHHWAGFFGGLLVLGHTMGNLTSLGTLLIALVLLVLGTSGFYFLEKRVRRPLNEATAELAAARKERTRLDQLYRHLYSRGMSATPQGIGAYNQLMFNHQKVLDGEKRVALLKGERNPWTWWRHTHNVGTMMLVGVLVVHIWSKIYFGGFIL